MKFYATLEHVLSFDRVTYYSFKVGDSSETNEISEFEDFKNKFGKTLEFRFIFGKLRAFGRTGARENYFRFEDKAVALPPYGSISELKTLHPEEENFVDLRLYCIRMSDRCVILLNGDIKTTTKALDCPNCRSHFQLANAISRKIDKGISVGDFSIETAIAFMSQNQIEF